MYAYVSLFKVLFVYVNLITTVRGTMPPQGHLAFFLLVPFFSFSYILQMLIIVLLLLKMEMIKRC